MSVEKTRVTREQADREARLEEAVVASFDVLAPERP
jgi:hypothetical protein